MSHGVRRLELRCRGCGWSDLCGPTHAADWLRRVGKLRRDRTPEPAIVYELFRQFAGEFRCPECGAAGLAVGAAQEDHAEWPGQQSCECCRRPIESERLELMPGARRCSACQRLEDSGKGPDRAEHCPRCGAPLEVRVAYAGGRTRYVLGCSSNPPCS